MRKVVVKRYIVVDMFEEQVVVEVVATHIFRFNILSTRKSQVPPPDMATASTSSSSSSSSSSSASGLLKFLQWL